MVKFNYIYNVLCAFLIASQQRNITQNELYTDEKSRNKKNIDMSKEILQLIKKEIESNHNCEVLSINYAELLSLCVSAKIKFKEDFHYKPDWLKHYSISTICFSEMSINITRRVDLFDCVKENSIYN